MSFMCFFEVELKSNIAILPLILLNVMSINIEKSMEKHVSDHSKHIWKWRRTYMVTNDGHLVETLLYGH